MTNHEILKADLLDIIFENRNKDYGAYTLRKYYDKRMMLSVTIVFVVIAICSFFILNQKQPPQVPLAINPVADTVTVMMPPEAPKPPEPPHSQPPLSPKQLASVKATSQISIVNDLVETDVPDQQMLAERLISNVNMDGPLPADPNAVMGNRLVPAPAAPGKHLEEETVSFRKDERDAAYPGGMDAFIRFLSKNLRVPGDLQPGEKVAVLARFKVDESGNISEITIINSAGKKYDDEVIRVFKRMPAWIPAMQNGHKVAIYFMQPVTFIGSQ